MDTIKTKEEYNKLISLWADAINSDKKYSLSFEHHLVYKELCGKDWKECLAETTREETLKYLYFNGAKKFFGECIPEEALNKIIDKINNEKGSAL